MKKNLTSSQHAFLTKELEHWLEKDILSRDQAEEISQLYTIRQLSFVRVLLVIGAILVGAGVLSFIAGNWELFPDTAKFVLILLGICGFYFAGWVMEEKYPKTSKSMYIVGVFIFGAGIFLIGQMFHLASGYQNAFLGWTLGAIPLALYLKDRWVMLFTILLAWIYGFDMFEWSTPYPWILALILPVLYLSNEKFFKQSKMLLFFLNGLTLYAMVSSMLHFDLDWRYIPIIMWFIGLGMMFFPNQHYRHIFHWQGAITNGAAGIMLSLRDYWAEWPLTGNPNLVAILFSLAYLGLVFYWLKKGSLAALLLVCAMIFRFYIDLSYDFLPKSLFFVLGGGLLIAFGFWFEQIRRKEVQNREQTKES